MTKPQGVKTRISIVIPVLNEADGIPQLRNKLGRVQSVLAEFGDIELVFVDDGSTDATLPLGAVPGHFSPPKSWSWCSVPDGFPRGHGQYRLHDRCGLQLRTRRPKASCGRDD